MNIRKNILDIFLEKKVCIVGTGFCGYAGYEKLSYLGNDLLLVEGGDLKDPVKSEDQSFYNFSHNKYSGKIKVKGDISYVKSDIDLSFRDRQFTVGGSSGKWAGFIKPLEASTYLNEYGVDGSKSWGGLDLQKFDIESLKLLNSPILDFNPKKVAKSLNIKLPELPKGLYYTVYSWAKKTLRLKDFWIDKATNDPNKLSSQKQVLYGFKLVDARIKDEKISQLEFRSGNKKLYVKADTFILGMGGIENARFAEILNKKSAGIEYRNSNVGNFQEHPHIYGIGSFNYGKNKIPEILKNKIPYYKDGNLVGKVKFNIVAWDGIGTPKVSFDLQSRDYKKGFLESFFDYFKAKIRGDVFITMRCEQTPNKKSVLDFNKNEVNWNVLGSDFKFYSDYLRRFVSFLNYSEMGKDFKLVQRESKNGFAFPESTNGGAHHMGTVPYFKNGSSIDKNFKHKNFSNLYIVGCSVFPTSGFENPTHGAISSTLAAIQDLIYQQEI